MISLTQRPSLFTVSSCCFAHPCVRDSDTAARETCCAAAQVCTVELFPTFVNWFLLCVFLSKPLQSLSMFLITWKGAAAKCQKTTDNQANFPEFQPSKAGHQHHGKHSKNELGSLGRLFCSCLKHRIPASEFSLGKSRRCQQPVQWMPLLNAPQWSGQTPPPAGSLATGHSTSWTKTTSFAPRELFANSQEPAGWILLPSY